MIQNNLLLLWCMCVCHVLTVPDDDDDDDDNGRRHTFDIKEEILFEWQYLLCYLSEWDVSKWLHLCSDVLKQTLNLSAQCISQRYFFISPTSARSFNLKYKVISFFPDMFRHICTVYRRYLAYSVFKTQSPFGSQMHSVMLGVYNTMVIQGGSNMTGTICV